MERLISSSSSLSAGASISKSRLFVPSSSTSASLAGIAAARSGFVLFRGSGFKQVGAVLSNYDEPHRPRTRSLSCFGSYAVPVLKGKGEHSLVDTQSDAGRDLAGVFLRKDNYGFVCGVFFSKPFFGTPWCHAMKLDCGKRGGLAERWAFSFAE